MGLIARHHRRLQRVAIIAIAAFITGITSIKAPRSRAVSFGDIELQGTGRATLKLTQVEPAPTEGEPIAMEVFARMTYASELSRFKQGLYSRTSFTLPSTRESGILVIDVDRTRGAKQWQAESNGLEARFYTLANKDARKPSFDGFPSSGSLTLEASVVGTERAGFRIKGWLEMRDPGEDRVADTADDRAFEIEIELESVPPPEEITGQTPRPPHEPTSGECDPSWCWQDDGYYDGYWYGPGCGDASVGYESTDDGCSSDTVDDDDVYDGGGDGGDGGVYDPYEPTVSDSSDDGCGSSDTSDDGYDGSDDSSGSGCEGSDDTDSSSSGGCDGGDDTSSSGCSDSSSSGCSDSSSGCGDAASGCSGCEGDTLEREQKSGDVGWIAVILFFGSLGAAVRRRD